MEILEQQIERMEEIQRKLDSQVRQFEKLTIDIAEGTARLLVVAESHEDRINRLEARS